MSSAPLTTQKVVQSAMTIQARLLEGAIAAQQSRGLRKALTTKLAEEVVEVVKAIAPPLVLELGAHQAWFSSTVKAALPDSRVLAFEANPDVHASHRERVGAAGVEYLHHAVSDRSGPLTLTIPLKEEGSAGTKKKMGSLLHHEDTVATRTVDVAGVRLDDVLGDEADRANVMWIDVEGAIGMVLRGAERALAACELVFVEIEPYQVWQGQMIDLEVFEVLGRFGLIPVLRDVQRKKRGYNALFLRPERLEDEAVRAAVDRYAAAMVSRPDGEAAGAEPKAKPARAITGDAAREQRRAKRQAEHRAAAKARKSQGA